MTQVHLSMAMQLAQSSHLATTLPFPARLASDWWVQLYGSAGKVDHGVDTKPLVNVGHEAKSLVMKPKFLYLRHIQPD